MPRQPRRPARPISLVGPHRALLRTGKTVTADAAGQSLGSIASGGSASANSALRGGSASSDNGAVKAGAGNNWSFSKDGNRRRRTLLLHTAPMLSSAAAQGSSAAAGSNAATANAVAHNPTASASNGAVSAQASLNWDADKGDNDAPPAPVIGRGVGAQSFGAGTDVDWSPVVAQRGAPPGAP